MTPAQFEVFKKALTLRARATAALVTAVHLSDVHKQPLETSISEVLSNSSKLMLPEVVTAVWAMRDELAALSRTIVESR